MDERVRLRSSRIKSAVAFLIWSSLTRNGRFEFQATEGFAALGAEP